MGSKGKTIDHSTGYSIEQIIDFLRIEREQKRESFRSVEGYIGRTLFDDDGACYQFRRNPDDEHSRPRYIMPTEFSEQKVIARW